MHQSAAAATFTAINTSYALAPIANHQAAKLCRSQRLRLQFQSVFRSDHLCVVPLIAGAYTPFFRASEKSLHGRDKLGRHSG